MSRIPLILFCFSITCFQLRGVCQSTGYKLETFGTRNGLLSSKIFALAQTTNRMLWIGTELGVSRYDGYAFTNYQYTAGNESIGRILCITQDSLKGIWIGGDNGLFYFFDDSFWRINLKTRSTIAVEALLTDASGNIWLGELNALYKITPAHIQHIQSRSSNTLDLLPYADFNERVFGLATDNRQNVYISGFAGVFKIPANKNNFEVSWQNPNPYQFVRSVAATSPDSIFWNCLDAHPGQMIRGNIFHYYDAALVGRTVFTNRQKVYALTTNGVSRLMDNRMQTLVSYDNLVNNAVAAIIDVEENVWIGTWEGLLKFRKVYFQQYNLEDAVQTEAFSFLERRNGELLFGSNRGKVFIKKEHSITRNVNIPPLFPLAEVLCMTETNDGALWAGSGYQGISRLKDKQLKNWKNGGRLKDNNCETLYSTIDGKLMACTEQGVTVIDPAATEPMQDHYPFQKKYTRYPELFGCFQTGNTGYWFYGNLGLYKLENNVLIDDSIQNMGVKNLYINKIVSDKKGNIWVATLGKGLLKCRLSQGQLVLQDQYDMKKGLPSNNALSVLVDKNDNIWWGDYMSLTLLLNPGDQERLTTFNEQDGLLSSYYQTLKLEQQKNGTIWALTSMGLVSFHPDSIGRNMLPPVLLMNHILVDHGKSMVPGTGQMDLSYKNNSPAFHFSAVCLTDPSKIRYAYRLSEVDSNWTYTSSRNVVFNFLQPGSYTFELKACNNNNVWSSTLAFPFTIRHPFWQTWWFRVSILFLAGLMIYGLFRRRIKALKVKADIKQQMTELEAKALRAQMNPHFIFNSLNAIQELIITKNFTEAYQYLSSFSKLLRMVLNNSEKNLIPLSAELEMNRHYLELESLRFKQSFHYELQVDPQIDEETTLVPSLLLQPFIENAIWHGLMHKDGEKRLAVSFTEENERLVCRIEDNGIGRERSAAIRAGKIGSVHLESKGMILSQQRIETLNQQLKENLSIQVDDIKDAEGHATGTLVIIIIPKLTTFIK